MLATSVTTTAEAIRFRIIVFSPVLVRRACRRPAGRPESAMLTRFEARRSPVAVALGGSPIG